MNIIQRNFFLLLRQGAFDRQEMVEPMSAHKWEKLYQLAVMHDVVGYVYEGLFRSRSQFFCRLTERQWALWEKTVEERRKMVDSDDTMNDDDLLSADHLTNPILNHKLQNILDDENSDLSTRRLLLSIIQTTRHILNEGMPVKLLTEQGQYLRHEAHHVDFFTLQRWLGSLGMTQMAQLQGQLLITLMGFSAEEVPFANITGKAQKKIERVAQELIEFTNTRAQDFYFSQGSDNIFVHTSNGSAMLGHVKRSARYFSYFPAETLTNFFASFAHSLSHIEE